MTTPEPAKPAEPVKKAEKSVNFSRLNGERWVLKLTGDVRQRDINHLSRILRVEYARMKRRQRIGQMKLDRNQEKTDAQG